MLQLPELSIFLQNLNLSFFIKGILLVLIAIYSIFTFFVYNKIRSLNRIVFFPPRSASNSLRLLALIYFFIVLSLFLLTLVIL